MSEGNPTTSIQFTCTAIACIVSSEGACAAYYEYVGQNSLIYPIQAGYPESFRIINSYTVQDNAKTMTHSIRCTCGRLKGTLNRNEDVNRCVCYCADCQAFARFLKRENEILDRMGGTSLIQTIPANITFTEGIENLACMRLTAHGLLRWYAACCNTPIGNTPPNPNISYLGLIHNCLSSDPNSLNKSFGSVRMHVNTKYAMVEDKPKSVGLLSGTLRLIGMMLKARFDGSYKQTPFFVLESGTPIVTPKVLNNQELKEVMDAV